MPRFTRLVDVDHTPAPAFEAGSLPEAEKERLCRSLLAEFGVTSIKVREPDGEMIHCCALPWHDDRNPSASLNYKSLTYNCLSCGSSGGLLWFIASCRGGDNIDARRWVADQTGTGADEQSLASLLDFFDAVYGKEQRTSAPLPRVSPRVLEPWKFIHPYLTAPKGEGGRGIPAANVMALSVGYGEFRMQTTDEHWITSERIVIPHFWRGDLVGWQTRRLVKDGTPKYQSSGDFPKDMTVYNHSPRTRPIIVESPMSVLAKYHLASDMESVFGAKVTDKQIRILGAHQQVFLWFDNDEAGWKATHSVGERLQPYTDVWVVESPYVQDPADLDDITFQETAKAVVPYALWKPPTHLVDLREGVSV